MLSCSRRLLTLSVGQACRVMGFAAPPLDRRALRRRYVELAQRHHPDQATPESSADRMSRVTDAYKTLERLLADGGRRAVLHAPQRSASRMSDAEAEAEAVAASFVAAGASLSMAGLTLPWQRAATAATREAQQRRVEDSAASLREFFGAVRAMERDVAQRAARLRSEQHMAEGSHGFTSEHFEELRRMQGNTPREGRRSLAWIVWKYYSRRFARARSRWWLAARYVILGH